MKTLKSINSGIRRVTGRLLMFLIGFMVSTILAQIILRRVFNVSMDFVIDVNRLCFIWSVFLGAGHLYGGDGLIRFDLFINQLSGRGLVVSQIISSATSLVFFLTMIYAGFLMIPFTRDQLFSTINVSYFWLYLPLIAGGFILALAAVEQLFTSLKSLNGNLDQLTEQGRKP